MLYTLHRPLRLQPFKHTASEPRRLAKANKTSSHRPGKLRAPGRIVRRDLLLVSRTPEAGRAVHANMDASESGLGLTRGANELQTRVTRSLGASKWLWELFEESKR
jgi:hypothetical protein